MTTATRDTSWLRRALLVARTIRHLRPVQIVHWPLGRLRRAVPARARVRGAIATARQPLLGREVRAWGPLPGYMKRADAVSEGVFQFLNHTERLAHIDWQRTYHSRLWTYQLHYFQYATDLAWAAVSSGAEHYRARLEQLIESWLDGTASGRGVAWEPYVISERVVAWIYAMLILDRAMSDELRARMVTSLLTQLRVLEARRELALQANHLQKNLFALAVGGLCFIGPDAERWRRVHTPRLIREFSDQILPDGVHAERSPMYHAIAMRDLCEFLLLRMAAGDPVAEGDRERARRAWQAYTSLTRADGSFHLINDCADGMAAPRAYLRLLMERVVGSVPEQMSPGQFTFEAGGFLGHLWSDGTKLLVDAKGPFPPHQPAHAHCGALSFEWDVAGRPVVVDSGVHGYEGDPFREYVRSTRAHNTIMIGGAEQSELWGTFRVARRSRVLYARHGLEGASYVFGGALQPYAWGAAQHERTIRACVGRLEVCDRVVGAPDLAVDSFVHLHPDFEVEPAGQRIRAQAGSCILWIDPRGECEVEIVRGSMDPVQGWYCPAFGRAIPAAAIILRYERVPDEGFGYTITAALDEAARR